MLTKASTKTSTLNLNQKTKKYVEASEKIRDAIDLLGVSASTDAIAREAVANLGVVLLDLNS